MKSGLTCIGVLFFELERANGKRQMEHLLKAYLQVFQTTGNAGKDSVGWRFFYINRRCIIPDILGIKRALLSDNDNRLILGCNNAAGDPRYHIIVIFDAADRKIRRHRIHGNAFVANSD